MEDLEIVVLQLFMPSRCPARQLPWGLPVRQVLVVSLDDEWLIGPNEVRVPVL